jgi:hypothetical protein
MIVGVQQVPIPIRKTGAGTVLSSRGLRIGWEAIRRGLESDRRSLKMSAIKAKSSHDRLSIGIEPDRDSRNWVAIRLPGQQGLSLYRLVRERAMIVRRWTPDPESSAARFGDCRRSLRTIVRTPSSRWPRPGRPQLAVDWGQPCDSSGSGRYCARSPALSR